MIYFKLHSHFFKVLGHEMDWNFVDIAWINLVLSKVCVKFSNVLDASPHLENNVYIFLAVNANPIPIDYVIRYPRLFGQIFLASYWPGQQPPANGKQGCFPLAGGIWKFYSEIFDHRPILRC